MHELSICSALLDQVEGLALQNHSDRVIRIELSVGPLSGVEPSLLEQAFEVAKLGTVAEESDLILTVPAVRVRCESCETETETTPHRLRCGTCGDWRTRVVAGDELHLLQLELETNEDPAHV